MACNKNDGCNGKNCGGNCGKKPRSNNCQHNSKQEKKPEGKEIPINRDKSKNVIMSVEVHSILKPNIEQEIKDDVIEYKIDFDKGKIYKSNTKTGFKVEIDKETASEEILKRIKDLCSGEYCKTEKEKEEEEEEEEDDKKETMADEIVSQFSLGMVDNFMKLFNRLNKVLDDNRFTDSEKEKIIQKLVSNVLGKFSSIVTKDSNEEVEKSCDEEMIHRIDTQLKICNILKNFRKEIFLAYNEYSDHLEHNFIIPYDTVENCSNEILTNRKQNMIKVLKTILDDNTHFHRTVQNIFKKYINMAEGIITEDIQ